MIESVERRLTREQKELAEAAFKAARALEETGELSRAIAFYSRALALEHDDADFIRGRIAELKARLERGDI